MLPPAPTTQAAPDLSGAAYKSTNSLLPAPGMTGNALLVSSSPARSVTTDNVAKLNTITAPPPTTPPTDTKTGSSSSPAITINNTPATQTTLAQDQEKAANQGKPGYDVLGNKISATPTDTASTDPYDAALKGIKDPGLAAQYKTSLQALDSEITAAKTTLDNAAALSANDPAAQAAIAGIHAKYAAQIQLMKDRNAQLIGKASSSVAAFGGLGPMGQSFLNDQQSRADERISTLQAQEQDAVTKMQIAYQTKDFKALNEATVAYDKANKSKLTALGDLLKETNKQVDQMQKQQKIDMAAEKQAVALDISKSSNLGTSIAKNIADSGITDEGQIDQYVQSMAEQYGITNPDILRSAVEKARQASIKSLAGSANTLDTIRNRNAPKKGSSTSTKGSGVDGGYKYSGSDIESYKGFLATGGTGPDGTVYAKQGSDTYSDPNAYVAALNDWVSNKGTAAGFAAKFPPKKYVNPLSYKMLPEAIRPKTTAAGVNDIP